MRAAYGLTLGTLLVAGCGTSHVAPPRADARQERAAVASFWRHLGTPKAFALMAPAEQARVGGRRAWLAGYTADPVQSLVLHLGDAHGTRVAVSSVEVSRMESGCRSYSGDVDLVRRGERWLIGYLELSVSPCD